ncbi:MAG: hypothetical protein COT84_05570 [Chlamydiae bacterium CG10_big_fil_rev_8_21_14_0_10_35_9]|nr:MAG: hypothetical protein COT84_05570 [Chlamydiae bacterium CG10_big_fil_rev_8_21_14_0_10_35_9]
MNKQFFSLFFFILSCFAHNTEWIDEQIKEDLEYLSAHPINSIDLERWFEILSIQGGQALYCKIRNHNVTWKKTSRSDDWRNAHVFSFIAALNAKYSLPDVDFILLTEDGISAHLEMPIFAFSKSSAADNTALFPDFDVLWEISDMSREWISKSIKWSKQYPWEVKKACAFFRGASTGIFDPNQFDFANDRVRAVIFSHKHPHLADVAFNVVFQPELMNFLNSIRSCVAGAAIYDHYKYKYLLDIDGNYSTSTRCRWILLSNSTLVKVMSQKSQWYYKALEPWVHFVPVEQDLADLEKHLNFLISNDTLAKEIADQGQELGKAIFSKDMVELYVIRLLEAYSKYINLNH